MYQHAFTGELISMRLRILRLQVLSEMQKQVRSSLVPSPTFLSRHATLGTECCVTRQKRLRVRLGWALVVHLSEVSTLLRVKENDWRMAGTNSRCPFYRGVCLKDSQRKWLNNSRDKLRCPLKGCVRLIGSQWKHKRMPGINFRCPF